MLSWLLPTLAAAFGVLGQATDSASRWFWVWNGIALAVVVAHGFVTWHIARVAADARDEFRLTLYDQFAPISRQLSLMATVPAADRKIELGKTIRDALNCAVGLTPAEKVRATYFKRVEHPESVPAFEPDATAGRGDPPQSVFRRDPTDVEGWPVWESAEADRPRFCRDVQSEPPPGWDVTKVRKYRTFITVPVRSGDDLVGLLTVNAPKPGDLSEDDVGTMWVIAGLVGAAIGIADGRSRRITS
ncbi:GAF domain-containing protein [Cellulomonas hominis]